MAAPAHEPTEPPTESTTGSLTLDQVYGLLGDRRRREVLRYMLDGPGSCTLYELAEHVARVESGEPASAVTADEQRRAYAELYHRHLPMFTDAGVLDFDGEAQVALADGAPDLGTFLSSRPDSDDRRPASRSPAPAPLVLIGVGVGAGGSLGLVQLVDVGAVAVVAVLALVVAAASHWASVLPVGPDRRAR